MNSKYTDLSNSFPAAVDTIDKMQDLTITTKKKADKYYEYINANNITGANDYLGKSENSDLLLSVFNADKFNMLRDMIISIERFFLDDIGVYLGELHDKEWQTPPDTNTTYGTASQGANGLMSAADKKKLDGIASGANNFTYSLPTASATVLGGVKTGSNITNTGGVLSLTKANVTSALGYTPPTTNTTYGNATTSSSGLMSSSDKSKLDGIATGANKTVVDNALSQGSANPVANSVVTKRLQYLYSFKISRDKWNESSDKSNWNVIVPWSDSKGTAITGSTTGTPNLTTNMSLGPAMMERTSSLKDNVILSGELSIVRLLCWSLILC